MKREDDELFEDFLEDEILADAFEEDPEDEYADNSNLNRQKAGRPQQQAKRSSSHSRKAGSKDSQRRKKKKGLNGHSLFFLIVGIIFAVTIIRLIVWNIGKHSGYDPNETTTEFDVELLDYVQLPDASMLEGRAQDDVNTILALGNDPFSDERGKNGLAALIEKETDSVVLNGALPESTIAMKYPEYSSAYPLDGLSLYWTVAALCNQNFDLMEKVVADLNSESANAALKTLKNTDLAKVDELIIFYDLQDFMGKRIVYDENNLNNLNTVYGSLNASIKLLQENFPHIRILVLSQTYGKYTEGDGTEVDGDRDDLGNGTIVDYINWELEVCRSRGVTFIDNYYGAVTVEDTDCLTDGFRLNEKGRQRVAKRFAEVYAKGKTK